MTLLDELPKMLFEGVAAGTSLQQTRCLSEISLPFPASIGGGGYKPRNKKTARRRSLPL
jgi:hypothetical protein